MADQISNPLLDLIKSQALLDDLQLEEVTQEHLRSGKPTGPPATKPVPTYRVKIEGDDVYVALGENRADDQPG